MKIGVEKNIIEKTIEHLEMAQKEFFAYETEFLIIDLKKALQTEYTNRDLLVLFYTHLCDNEPLPINKFSMEREIDRFIHSINQNNI